MCVCVCVGWWCSVSWWKGLGILDLQGTRCLCACLCWMNAFTSQVDSCWLQHVSALGWPIHCWIAVSILFGDLKSLLRERSFKYRSWCSQSPSSILLLVYIYIYQISFINWLLIPGWYQQLHLSKSTGRSKEEHLPGLAYSAPPFVGCAPRRSCATSATGDSWVAMVRLTGFVQPTLVRSPWLVQLTLVSLTWLVYPVAYICLPWFQLEPQVCTSKHHWNKMNDIPSLPVGHLLVAEMKGSVKNHQRHAVTA